MKSNFVAFVLRVIVACLILYAVTRCKSTPDVVPELKKEILSTEETIVALSKESQTPAIKRAVEQLVTNKQTLEKAQTVVQAQAKQIADLIPQIESLKKKARIYDFVKWGLIVSAIGTGLLMLRKKLIGV